MAVEADMEGRSFGICIITDFFLLLSGDRDSFSFGGNLLAVPNREGEPDGSSRATQHPLPSPWIVILQLLSMVRRNQLVLRAAYDFVHHPGIRCGRRVATVVEGERLFWLHQ